MTTQNTKPAVNTAATTKKASARPQSKLKPAHLKKVKAVLSVKTEFFLRAMDNQKTVLSRFLASVRKRMEEGVLLVWDGYRPNITPWDIKSVVLLYPSEVPGVGFEVVKGCKDHLNWSKLFITIALQNGTIIPATPVKVLPPAQLEYVVQYLDTFLNPERSFWAKPVKA